MKGLITLTLLVATFLGGYHLGRNGALSDLSGDKVLKSGSQLLDGLRKLVDGDKKPAVNTETTSQAPTPQPAQIATPAGSPRQGGQDAIVLHINGKRYVVCEARQR